MVNNSAPFCTTATDLGYAASKTVIRYATKDVAHFISDLVARLDYESRRAA